MNRNRRIPALTLLALALPISSALAQRSGITAVFNGTQGSPSPQEAAGRLVTPAPRATQASPAVGVITFNKAAVGVSTTAAQTLTATFTVSGYGGTFTPTASLHYGTSYSAAAISCTGTASPETCTVALTFKPIYPGGRHDALFLSNGSTRLATVLLYGVGTSPFAMVQPGVITQPITSGGYYYTGIVDENGTAYILGDNTNTVFSITSAGVVTQLPITGLNSPRDIGVDGAGILYIADQTPKGSIITYDTVQGIQGTAPFASAEFYNQGVAVGNTGNIYLTDSASIYAEPLAGTGTAQATPITPGNTQASTLIVDSAENVFISGYAINELTPAGVQTQVNTTSGNSGLGVDAADTLYSGRYGPGGIGELPASNYATSIGALDGSAPVLGVAVGVDGTVYAGDYNAVDKIDRSHGAFTFNALNLTQTATPQIATLYNGGNLPLTVSGFALTGDPNYTLTANGCTSGTVIAPGAVCSVTVNFTSPGHGGVFTGNLAITSNSLNTSTTSNIALTDTVQYPYVTVSPSSLTFSNQALGTTSAAQTVTYTNSGAAVADLYASNVSIGSTITNQFSMTLSSGCASIPIGGTCTASVVFKPTVSGTTSATGNAYLSLGTPSPVTFAVTGTSLPAAPAITFNPTPVAFGNQAAGTTGPATIIQLTNSGTAPLTLTSIGLTGTNPANFILLTAATNPCTGTITLAAAASCNLSVAFNPNAAGVFAASLSVAGNVTGSPQTVPLTGTGTLAAAPQLQFTPSQLTFFAGSGAASLNGTGNSGPALAATFDSPINAAQDAAGNTYIVDQGANTVRKVDPSGNITLFAGIPGYGPGSFAGDGGLAINANLSSPIGVAVDSYGNVYIADYGNLRVRKVVPATGIITTYIGNGSGFYNGSPGPATPIPGPNGICFDPAGNLYIASTNAALVLKVTPSLAVSILAGKFTGLPNGQAGYNGDNIPANTAAVNFPNTVASDQSGNIYIADTANNRVRMVAAGTAIITTVAGNGNAPTSPVTGDGAPATSAAISASAVATNLAGDLFISGQYGSGGPNLIRKVPTTGPSAGILSTVAGGGATPTSTSGPATSALLGALGWPGISNTGSILIPSSGTGNYGVLSAGPSGFLLFANQNINTSSAAQTVTFENTSNTSLTLTSSTYTASGNFAVTGGTCPSNTTLAPGATCTLAVTFTPASGGTLTGTISVPSNASTSPQTIYLQGTGVAALAPQAVLSPAALAFNNTPVGTPSAAQTLTLSNPGTAALTISGISITGTNASSFAQTNTCGTTLAAAASCTIAVTFTPASATSFSASVSVADNASGSPQSIPLTGSGIAPQATLTTLNAFPNTPVGTSSAVQTVTLANPGNAALSISGISIGGANPSDFTQTNTCGTSVAASSSCTISITFTPASAASFSATLSVADNASTTPQTLALTGTGTAPQAVLTPASLTFAATTVNTSAAAQTLTLSNPGNQALTLSGISLTGANPTAFAQTNTCGSSLPASSSCTISITFTPAAAVSYSASVSVADNASSSPQLATITGTGAAVAVPQAVLSPATLTFPTTSVGSSSAILTSTLSNPGNASLAISGIALAGANPTAFAQTNTCAATLAAGASCILSVTFTPASAASFTAALSISDNASGSPQTLTLSGTGVAVATDYSVTSSTPTQSVQPGATANFTINAAALGGTYNNPVVLSATGLPPGASYTFTPPSVTPGLGSATSVLSVTTPSQLAQSTPPAHLLLRTTLAALPLASLLLLPCGTTRRLRRGLARTPLLTLALVFATLLTLASSGCAGGYFGPTPQTYTLTVTGTSGNLSHSTNLTLTVQ